MEKQCKECGEIRSIEDFYFIKARQRYMHYCKFCHGKKIKTWRDDSIEYKQYHKDYQQGEKYKKTVSKWRRSDRGRKLHRERMRRIRVEIKKEVFTHYCEGEPKCQKCGFSDIRALTIDHKNGDGAKHRKDLKACKLYPWLKRNKYPEGFQVLCMNCQFIKKFENKEHSPRIEE